MFKFIFIVSIVVGFVVPLTPIIASMADFAITADSAEEFASGGLGYASFRFPPLLCTATNGNILFYTLSLPLNIIVIIGVMELILIFWRIHKVRFVAATVKMGALAICHGTAWHIGSYDSRACFLLASKYGNKHNYVAGNSHY